MWENDKSEVPKHECVKAVRNFLPANRHLPGEAFKDWNGIIFQLPWQFNEVWKPNYLESFAFHILAYFSCKWSMCFSGEKMLNWGITLAWENESFMIASEKGLNMFLVESIREKYQIKCSEYLLLPHSHPFNVAVFVWVYIYILYYI